MFGFRRNKRPASISNLTSYLGNSLKNGLSPLFDRLYHKSRLKGRVRLANRWALNHPRRFLASFLAVMLFIGLTDFTVSAFFHKRTDTPQKVISNLMAVNNMFNGMQRLRSNREVLRRQLQDLVSEGDVLLNKVDSLYCLPVKSRQDSVNMKNSVERLNSIREFIREHTRHNTNS